MASPSRITPALIAFGLLAGALLIYLGASLTSPDAPPQLAGATHPAWSDSLKFSEWDEVTWKAAGEKPSLVLLLVGDSLTPESREVEARFQQDTALRSVIASNFLAVRVDRRARPDLALRYAEDQIPHLSVLLPTGEALARITGDPETWLEQLLETGRYWRDHKGEIGGRVEAFWTEVQADSVGPEATESANAQIGQIDSALFLVVHNLLESVTPGPGIWRTDFDAYLQARHTAGADSLRQALKAERELRVAELNSPLDLDATPAEWAFTVIELRRHQGCDFGDSTLLKVQEWFAQVGGSATAEEEALSLRLALLLNQERLPAYPGFWLGLDSGYTASLPHSRHRPAALDGYLMDAIAWLDLCVESGDPLLLASALRLGDSLWSRLWDPSRRALSDKPQVPGGLREVAVYPRAQLGRVANLFDRLANLTGEPRFGTRADSCLAGFAPYAHAAGAAGTYYGEALLRRSQPADPGAFRAGAAKFREVGTDAPL